MSEYYFNKGFVIFEFNEYHLKKLPSEVKDRFGAELAVNTDLVLLYFKTIPSTSNTLKNLLINSNYHSSYSTQ